MSIERDMADIPLELGSPEDLYPFSDQDEAMDTDSEVDDSANIQDHANGDTDGEDVSEAESSIRMEISDNEDPDDEPPSSANNHTTSNILGHQPVTNDQTNNQPVQDAIDRIVQNSDSHMSQQRKAVVATETILDLRQLVYGLTLPLWQRIFLYLPPTSLGKLLCTSRVFHALLAPQNPEESALQGRFRGQADFASDESIWQKSRNLFAPGLPKPLKNKSELEMWQMLCGQRCQICQQVKPFMKSQGIDDPWHAGPGDNGLRLIWICATLICGTCLPRQCQQEVSLQLSSTFPSFLIQALPPLFLTQNNDWIPESTLLSQPAPPNLHIQKLYSRYHIEHVLHQFKEVKDLGEAAAEEWLKGLDTQRREQLDDAGRWEQWELKGGFQKFLNRRSPKLPTSIPSQPPNTAFSLVSGPSNAPSMTAPSYIDHNIPPYHLRGPPPMPMMPPMAPMPFQGYPPLPYGGFQQPPPAPLNPQIGPGRPRRSLQEVNEARAARRQEIERRCLELDSPITPKVLSHMQSFQAALQISFPFTDKDWEVLKPRLLAQREAAEAQEAELAEQLKAIHNTAVQPSLEVLLMKDPNELSDSDWEQLQASVRDTLAKYAGEYINERWEGGSRVDHENVTHFTPDVLLCVRARYYESLTHPNPTGGPQSPRIPLSLESMKWLYDNKVKPLAEIHQKEIFQCSGCDSNSKYYGFEGVIQHYAAKHTTALSLGNVIVNWRKEWPEVPPFNPNPGSTTNGWHGSSLHESARPISASNIGEYGQPFQAPPHPQQGGSTGTAPYPYNYGASQQVPPFFGQPDGAISQLPPRGYSADPHALANLYGTTPGPDQVFPIAQVPYMAASAASDLHRKQLTDMAQYSRDLWNATMGIKELPASVRIYVLIHHMSVKFEKKFGTIPEVSMFLHGLNENAQMRPIRSLNGLSCKACTMNGHSLSSDRKVFTLPALVNHFRNAHLGQTHTLSDIPEPDWRTDMIDLPEDTVTESLVDSNGMDDRKFSLIAEVFPEVFPSPLPALSTFKESRAKAAADRVRLENLRALEFKSTTSARQAQQLAVSAIPSRSGSQRVSQERLQSRSPFQSDSGTIEAPKEDEYDPSRNTFIGDIVEHSGIRRSESSQKPANIPLPPGIISLGVVDSNGQPESPHTQGGYADRLLRHHRGLARRPTESHDLQRENFPIQEHLNYSQPLGTSPSDVNAADRFLKDLAPTTHFQHDRDAHVSNAYSPVENEAPRRFDYAVRPLSREPDYIYPSVRYTQVQSTFQNGISTSEQRFGNQAYLGPVFYEGNPPSDRRETHPVYANQTQPQVYPNRDRSRSPRRSIPREYVSYDPNIPQPPYEARQDARWRGESPPRSSYYRSSHEIPQGTRPDSFVARDAQGRNVRYIAVPVQEYESQPSRYPPARAAIPEPISYVGRAGEIMEAGSDGRFYVVDGRGPVRYSDDPAENGYRDYR